MASSLLRLSFPRVGQDPSRQLRTIQGQPSELTVAQNGGDVLLAEVEKHSFDCTEFVVTLSGRVIALVQFICVPAKLCHPIIYQASALQNLIGKLQRKVLQTGDFEYDRGAVDADAVGETEEVASFGTVEELLAFFDKEHGRVESVEVADYCSHEGMSQAFEAVYLRVGFENATDRLPSVSKLHPMRHAYMMYMTNPQGESKTCAVCSIQES